MLEPALLALRQATNPASVRLAPDRFRPRRGKPAQQVDVIDLVAKAGGRPAELVARPATQVEERQQPPRRDDQRSQRRDAQRRSCAALA